MDSNKDNNYVSQYMKEYDERVLKGATSGKSYSADTFEKIWELINFSDKKILGINWNELDREKIEKQLSSLGLKIRQGKSPVLVGFNLEFIAGDTVDGTIAILKNRSHFQDGIDCSFGFIDRKVDKLVGWIEKKYGQFLNLRDDTLNEYHYDWLVGDVGIVVDIVKSSGLGDMTFNNLHGYAKVIRGEISKDEFFKNYIKENRG